MQIFLFLQATARWGIFNFGAIFLASNCTVHSIKWIPSNRVISSPFSNKTFFSQNYVKVPYIFFLVGNS
jgi:hypothetical protein